MTARVSVVRDGRSHSMRTVGALAGAIVLVLLCGRRDPAAHDRVDQLGGRGPAVFDEHRRLRAAMP
jgi:hypothetical protein